MSFAPLGQIQMFHLTCPTLVVSGSITNPDGPLKLGGFTNVSGSTASYLLVSSDADGVHLSEPVTNTIVLDTPLSSTQPLKAVSILSTGDGAIGGDFIVAGQTGVQGLTVAGAAAFASGVSVAGPLNATAVSVSGTTLLQGDTSLGGSLAVAGAAVFRQTLSCGALSAASASVAGAVSVGDLLTATSLSVLGGSSLGSLSVTGASSLNTLATLSTAAFGSGVTVAADLAVNGGGTFSGSNGVTVSSGILDLAGSQVSATSASLSIATGGVVALAVDGQQNVTLPSGSLLTASVGGINGQALVLKGANATSTVHIAGNLLVDGDYNQADKQVVQIEDTVLTLAHCQTSPQPDSVADGAGISIEGDSGFAKSITWRNNLGLAYNGQAGGLATEDGLSYFQVQGGNLMLSRVIPAANHISRSTASGAWEPDSVETVVSYAFRIDDQETLQIAKVRGTDYATPAIGGGYEAIGQAAAVCTTYEISVQA